MPFRDPKSRLRDISESINHIQQFVHGMKLSDYLSDTKAQAAVERKLMLLSQAANRLGPDAEALCPKVPWNGIRGMSKWLHHQYDRVNPEAVWNTVVDDLPSLRDAVEKALS